MNTHTNKNIIHEHHAPSTASVAPKVSKTALAVAAFLLFTRHLTSFDKVLRAFAPRTVVAPPPLASVLDEDEDEDKDKEEEDKEEEEEDKEEDKDKISPVDFFLAVDKKQYHFSSPSFAACAIAFDQVFQALFAPIVLDLDQDLDQDGVANGDAFGLALALLAIVWEDEDQDQDLRQHDWEDVPVYLRRLGQLAAFCCAHENGQQFSPHYLLQQQRTQTKVVQHHLAFFRRGAPQTHLLEHTHVFALFDPQVIHALHTRFIQACFDLQDDGDEEDQDDDQDDDQDKQNAFVQHILQRIHDCCDKEQIEVQEDPSAIVTVTEEDATSITEETEEHLQEEQELGFLEELDHTFIRQVVHQDGQDQDSLFEEHEEEQQEDMVGKKRTAYLPFGCSAAASKRRTPLHCTFPLPFKTFTRAEDGILVIDLTHDDDDDDEL